MNDNESLRERALAGIAEGRQREYQARREYEKKVARQDAEEGQRLITASINTMREILDYETVESDWKVEKKRIDDDGVYTSVYVARTTIMGVQIYTNPWKPAELRIEGSIYGELTLGSFGQALAALERRGTKDGTL
jgi:hypothetical protein